MTEDEALVAIADALSTLDNAAKNRVIQYFFNRFCVTPPKE